MLLKLNRTFLTFIISTGMLFSGVLGCGGGGGGSSSLAEVFLEGLFFPVSMEFSPDGRMFFTELSGNIWIAENGVKNPSLFAVLEVAGAGNEGLTGLALDPNFFENSYVYVFNTLDNPLRSRVVRFTDQDGVGVDPLVIIDNLPAGGHNGGPLEFGLDGSLYISIGDADVAALAQDPESLAGKLLRINPDGSIPADNPTPNSPIFASGVRNVFGMDKQPTTGTIYFSENGPDCDDELNRLQPGANFGWREGQPCSDDDATFTLPLAVFNPSIGPTGIHFYRSNRITSIVGVLLWGEFDTGVIRRFVVVGDSFRALGNLVDGEYGSILGITEDQEGRLYFSTTDAIYRIE